MNRMYFLFVFSIGLTAIPTACSLNYGHVQKTCFAKLLVKDSDKAFELLSTNPKLFPYINKVDECRKGNCSLSRTVLPNVRKKFEDHIVTKIEDEYTKTKSLVYTSFGSGYLYQDFVLITKLCAKGFKKIIVQLIDPIYENQSQFTATGLQQFSQFFSDTPTQVTVKPYPGSQSYICAIKQGKAPKSDVICSIDNFVHFANMNNWHDCIPIFKDAQQLVTHGLQPEGMLASLIGGTISPQIGSKPSFSACIWTKKS